MTRSPLFIKNQLARCQWIETRHKEWTKIQEEACKNFVTRIFLTNLVKRFVPKLMCETHFQRIKSDGIESQYFTLRRVRI